MQEALRGFTMFYLLLLSWQTKLHRLDGTSPQLSYFCKLLCIMSSLAQFLGLTCFIRSSGIHSLVILINLHRDPSTSVSKSFDTSILRDTSCAKSTHQTFISYCKAAGYRSRNVGPHVASPASPLSPTQSRFQSPK